MTTTEIESDYPPEILIAVMGATGTGKTSFVNRASGASFVASDDLASCTSEVAVTAPFEISGRKVALIDTPGFDDTILSDIQILNKIAQFLYCSYEMGCKLSGIIYLHRISDNRVGGATRKNFNVFKQMCGEETLRNVIVTTTMWDTISPQVGQSREKELASDDRFYKTILDNGARMVRHDNTTESARQILRLVIDNHPLPLHIQDEMLVENKDLSQTDAAAVLDRSFMELEQRYQKELEKVQKALERAVADNHEEMARMFQQFKEEYESKVREIEKAKKDRRFAFSLFGQCKEKFQKAAQEVQATLAETRRRREEARNSTAGADDAPENDGPGSRGRAMARGLSVVTVVGIIMMLL